MAGCWSESYTRTCAHTRVFTTSLLRYIVLGIPHSVRFAHSNRQNKENDEDWSIVSVANYAE